MIGASAIQAILNQGSYLLVDLVTLTIKRGRCHQFGAGYLGAKEILDSVRWTSAPRELRANVSEGLKLFAPLSGVAYRRGSLEGSVGAEVLTLGMGVTGTLPVSLSTAQDGSGSFSTTLGELALLGMLDGAQIAIDQAVLNALPSTPASAGASYGIISPDPVRKFAGVVRGVTPTSWGIEFDCCDPLIQGGGSVPRSVFSPLCRWEFGSGVGCPVEMTTTTVTRNGSEVIFPGDGTVVIAGLPRMAAWAFLTPEDGPMMGMSFQIGGFRGAGVFDFADRLPWAWSCSTARIEYRCSKGYPASADGSTAFGCSDWDAFAPGTVLPKFGGQPDMPQPESA